MTAAISPSSQLAWPAASAARQALERGRGEPLHEDRAQELAGRGVTGMVRHDLDGHAERAEHLRERLRAGARRQRRCPEPACRDRPEQRDVREPCARSGDERGEVVLQCRRRRVQVGVDRAGAQSRQRRLGRGERSRRGRQGEHDRASGDRRDGVTGLVDALRSRDGHRVVAAHLDAGGDEVGGESTTGLAETEHR